MEPFLRLTGLCESAKSAFIVVFLIGRDENQRDELALLSKYPGLCTRLLEVFDNTLHSMGGNGYILGSFCVLLIVAAIRDLTISDSNKAILVQSNVLTHLICILERYVQNANPIKLCGGGGDDPRPASMAIEAILQLSFHFESMTDLQDKYMTSDINLVDVLTKAASITGNRALNDETMKNVNILLLQLKPVYITKLDIPLSPSSVTKKHVMLSYCWSSKKELVVALAKILRANGLDVWRDEDGSSIVPPMKGPIIERMAEAIEASHTVIVCVSPEYKQSPNVMSIG